MSFIGVLLRWFGKQDSWMATQIVIFKKFMKNPLWFENTYKSVILQTEVGQKVVV